MLTRDGADPIIVDAAISSLSGVEADVLTKVMQAKAAGTSTAPDEAVSMLAGAVAKTGDVAAVQRVLDVAVDASRPEWERTALLRGLDAGLPARSAGGRGRGGRGGRGGGGGLPGLSAPGGIVVVTPGRGVSLPAEPAALTALASGHGAIADLAGKVSAKLDWPGRPEPVITARAPDAGAAEALRCRRRDLQEHLHGLSSGRRPRQGQARRESRRLGLRERG